MLEQQLKELVRVLKPLAGLLIVALLIVGAFSYHDYLGSFYYVIFVDGQAAGVVKDPVEIRDHLLGLREEARERYGVEVVQMEKPTAVPVQDKALSENPAQVKDQLTRGMTFKIEACQLLLNGTEAFIVPDREAYNKVLELIKGTYVREGQEVVQVAITDSFDCREVYVNPYRIIEPEAVVSYLMQGRNRRQVYLVSRGDSLWDIARQQNTTVEDLRQANPQLNGDLLSIGEELNLSVVEPLINVEVTELITREENIPFETETTPDPDLYQGKTREISPGEKGLKEVTYEVTYKNGVEVDREEIQEIIIQEPVSREVAEGTRKPPAVSSASLSVSGSTVYAADVAGTGSFIWPTSASRVSSYFGPRGRGFHYGIDVCGPRGTPIFASDDGIVSFSGYSGAYGNMVIINHGGGYSTYYAHNTSNLVSAGDKVTQGQEIATMGTTGDATGPHVHFEVRKNGTAVNPMNYYTR